jgi:hypothetical protein
VVLLNPWEPHPMQSSPHLLGERAPQLEEKPVRRVVATHNLPLRHH